MSEYTLLTLNLFNYTQPVQLHFVHAQRFVAAFDGSWYISLREVCHAKSGQDEKWTGGRSNYGDHSLKKAVLPSEKWTGCSFISLARLWDIKSITKGTFITVLYHDREFRLFCDSHYQRDSWPQALAFPLLAR